jgi:hypothetical protein
MRNLRNECGSNAERMRNECDAGSELHVLVSKTPAVGPGSRTCKACSVPPSFDTVVVFPSLHYTNDEWKPSFRPDEVAPPVRNAPLRLKWQLP